MPIWSRIRGVCSTLAGRGRIQRDLDEEVGGYFDTLVDEYVAQGFSTECARRQARLDMEGVEQVKESVRASRPAAWLDTIVRDVRYSIRLLSKTPAFSLTAVLVLALGIGANSAVFSLINLIAFQPPPGANQPGEMVSLHSHDPRNPDSYRPFTYGEYETIRDEAALFDDLLAHQPVDVSLTDAGATRRGEAALVTASYFDTLGARLAAGRTFSRDEERPGSGAAVLVLSHTAWKRLGGGPDVLGRTLVVNAHPFTVVGIAPEGFAGTLLILGPDFWMPLGAADLLTGGTGRAATSGISSTLQLMIVGRLKPRLTVESANEHLRVLSARWQETHSLTEPRQLVTVVRTTRTNQGTRPQRPETVLLLPFGALMGAALIVLLVASLNVANMQLARGTSRRKEIAMRLALGAGRGRIVGQLLIEGLLLALAGGAGGLLLGVWTMHLVVASVAPLVDKTFSVSLAPDWRVCLAALTFSAVTAIASGLGPAWRLSRLDLLPEMKSQEGSGAVGGIRRFGPRNVLVAGQIALSLALLAASGLFVRAAVAAGRADPGYRLDNQLLLRVDAAPAGYDEVSGREAFRRLLDRIRSTPGVDRAAMASIVAFGQIDFSRRVARSGGESGTKDGALRGVVAQSFNISASYFETLGLAILRGREFNEAEATDPRATDVAIIDEPLAATLYPGQDPVGQLLTLPGKRPRTVHIVGVAPGLRQTLADRAPVPHIYFPLGPNHEAQANIHVHVAAGSSVTEMRARLRDAVRMEDTRLAVLGIQTLDQVRDSTGKAWIIRSAGKAFGAFGGIALLMATIGLYGVKAYVVARRTREIGIRMALGANAQDVVRMVVREGAVLLAASISVGLLLAIGLAQAMSSLLVGVHAFDPLVLFMSSAVLCLAVLAACYLPARRATRVSPVTALRVE